MAEHWVSVCNRNAFENRDIVGVNADGVDLVIVRADGQLFAAERACPHEGADLALGRCQGLKLRCPRHLAWFDLQSGAVLPGWSFRSLRMYPVRLRDCVVQVDIASGTG